MTESAQSWPAHSYLDGLRPGPDETVELAILAAYSADLPSIGAALLALAGKDSDGGKGSPSDLADAVEQLRGKVRIVIQRGRLARMRRTPRIAAVLDQFVREVDFDEAEHSWHPKVAMVQMRSGNSKSRWRLWIGSRNLTECVNRDIGILMLSGGTGARQVPGVDALARSLAERAELPGIKPGALARTTARIAWHAPAGVTVVGLRWSDGKIPLAIPAPPARADEVIVVSPFIDQTFLGLQMSRGEGPPRRTLLTTKREIDRLGPFLAVCDDLLALDAPEFPIADPDPAGTTDDSSAVAAQIPAEEEQIGMGLHAKLVFWRKGRTRRLWLGSANATRRAWSGKNAEATLELQITAAVQSGLQALIGSARCVNVPEEAVVPDSEAQEEEDLERARSQVAARMCATLRCEGTSLHLDHQSSAFPLGPHPDDARFKLEVGALSGELQTWSRGTVRICLGDLDLAERSEFVRLRISLGDKGLSWLQCAPVQPSLGLERDRAAFVRLLGARGFLMWVAGLLGNDGDTGHGDWTIEQATGHGKVRAEGMLGRELPTFEDILAAWSRDQSKFEEIGRRVADYLPAVVDQARREDPGALALLASFADLWRKVGLGLGTQARKRRQ